jgi:hypothetical protein
LRGEAREALDADERDPDRAERLLGEALAIGHWLMPQPVLAVPQRRDPAPAPGQRSRIRRNPDPSVEA